MHAKKIDLQYLRELLAQGKSQQECAAIIGVTPAAISKAAKGLKCEVAQSLPPETSQMIYGHVLDVADGLKGLFKLTMKKEEAIAQELNQTRGMKRIRLHDLHLRCLAELRSQWAARHQVLKTFYTAETFEDLKDAICDVVKDEAPDVQEKISKGLAEKLS